MLKNRRVHLYGYTFLELVETMEEAAKRFFSLSPGVTVQIRLIHDSGFNMAGSDWAITGERGVGGREG